MTARILQFRVRTPIRVCAVLECRAHFTPRAEHHVYCDDCHFWSRAIHGMLMARDAFQELERRRQ
jgi:hypothetical protein